MNQDKTSWLKLVAKDALDYHERQFRNPYRSTIFFCNFLESLKLLSKKNPKNILDIGCGLGANLNYMATRYPNSTFAGIDINKSLVTRGNIIFKKRKLDNCKLEIGDLYELKKNYRGSFDGIISLQTLSWLPSYELPIKEMIKLKPEWIAISSLFYNGFVECEIKVRDYTKVGKKKPEEVFYNVYSLRLIQELFKKNGYKKFKYMPFIIDVDIKKNKDGRMGTYTLKTENGSRLQISGPLLMNWYFIVAQK